jgi:hypothetical protein
MTAVPVPEATGLWQRGGVIGQLGDETYDPFARTEEGLLLAESFARASLSEPAAAASWYLRHGAVDADRFLPPMPQMNMSRDEGPRFQDATDEALWQQANVAWHLQSLARLSDHLPARSRMPADRPPRWDERWAQPAIWFGDELVWIGGTTEVERRIPMRMMGGAEPVGPVPGGVSLTAYAERWREANAAYQRLISDEVGIIAAPPALRRAAGATWTSPVRWSLEPELDLPAIPTADPREELIDGLTSGWWGLAELQRRLIEPYVRKADEPEIALGWASRSGTSQVPEDGALGRLLVHERRRWSSLLAPVYLQLLEGLRRVTEGNKAAAFCKECRQPFLTLDARRSVFCTDRERLRYGQRERRRRLGAAGSAETHR